MTAKIGHQTIELTGINDDTQESEKALIHTVSIMKKLNVRPSVDVSKMGVRFRESIQVLESSSDLTITQIQYKMQSYILSNPMIVMEGPLIKRGRIRKNWKLRWFVLRRDAWCYFTKPRQANPLGTIPISDIIRVESADHLIDRLKDHPEIVHPNQATEGIEIEIHPFIIRTRWRSMQCIARCKEVRDEWVTTANQLIQKNYP